MAAGVSFNETLLERLEYGLICRVEAASLEPAPETATGTIQVIEKPLNFLKKTRTIPMVKGLGFAVDLTPAAPWRLDNVQVSLQHPPYYGSGETIDRWTAAFDGSTPTMNFFEFEHDFEMVAGVWTLSAYQDQTLIYSVSFDVVPAQDAPDLAALCSDAMLTS